MNIIQKDVKYLPKPNWVETIITNELAPPHLSRTAFIVALDAEGNLVLANNRRRGLETPGGHIDPGETAEMAAERELWEETGLKARNVIPLGFLQMRSEGTVPADWKYPHPLGYQQFFAALVDQRPEYTPNDECLMPVTLSAEQALEQEGVLSASQRMFYLAACKALLSPEIWQTIRTLDADIQAASKVSTRSI